MLDFVKKHMGWVTLLVILGALAAPTIFTMSGFECFNKTTTGQIGDTIGGTTAPFWGFLSVILLYLTFREQQDFNREQQRFNREQLNSNRDQQAFNREQLNFNKTQQAASDYDILMKIRDNISNLSNNLEVNITCQNPWNKFSLKGASHIDELRSTLYPNNHIDETEFDKLYKNVIEIAELCLLYYNLVQHSSLENDLKRAFVQPILIHSEAINRLFFLYQQKNINITGTMASIGDDLFQRYAETNNRFLQRFTEVQSSVQSL